MEQRKVKINITPEEIIVEGLPSNLDDIMKQVLKEVYHRAVANCNEELQNSLQFCFDMAQGDINLEANFYAMMETYKENPLTGGVNW